MNAQASVPTIPARRRLLRIAAVIAIVLMLLVAIASWLMQPQRATAFLLNQVGNALGLRITASGINRCRP